MAAQGHDLDAIWQQIEELVVLSLLSVQPLLQLNYRTAFPATDSGFSCFELLGYDVLLDEKCRPWLLEVSLISFACACALLLLLQMHLATSDVLCWSQGTLTKSEVSSNLA